MIEVPIFLPHFHIETIRNDGVYLVSEFERKILKGYLYESVAPLIDGKRTSDEICDLLFNRLTPVEVYYSLNILEKKGYIIEGKDLDVSGSTAYWTATGINPSEVLSCLEKKSISIRSLGDFPVNPLTEMLKMNGINISDDGDLEVVLVDEYLRTELNDINKSLINQEKPWMIIKPVGLEIFIGPIFNPKIAGCWRCLRDHYIHNREEERLIMYKKGRKDFNSPPKTYTPSTIRICYSIAAQEITKWLTSDENHTLNGKMVSLDTRTWNITNHQLIQHPHCPACGKEEYTPLNKNDLVPLVLQNQRAIFIKDGGYRTCTPQETINNLETLISPVTGIINSLECEFGLEDPVHVFSINKNFSNDYDDLSSIKRGVKNTCTGKGAAKIQAKASGICEAVERYSASYYGNEKRILSNLFELGSLAIHPNDIMLYSNKQFTERKENYLYEDRFIYVPEPLEDPNIKIEWTPVWSLTNKIFKYILTQQGYFRYYHPDGKKHPVYASTTSNGIASGNTIEEAILQGILELVERDSLSIWWFNKLSRPGVDLKSFNEPYFDELVSYYKELKRDIWVLDITTDLNIPVFAALSSRTDLESEHVIMGFGCHIDARLAIQRALTEMNQYLTYIQSVFNHDGTRTAQYGSDDLVDWWINNNSANTLYVVPDSNQELRSKNDYPNDHSTDILENIRYCQRIVEKQDFEVLVLDQTRMSIGFPVTKVFIPGLRQIWSRFAPGRLFSVPVKMSWLEQPLNEEEFNQIPFIF